jgi:hypothetical protein
MVRKSGKYRPAALCAVQAGGEGHVFIGSDEGLPLCHQPVPPIKVSWRVETQDAIRSTPCITDDFIILAAKAAR